MGATTTVILGEIGPTGATGATGATGPQGWSVGTYTLHILGPTGATGPMVKSDFNYDDVLDRFFHQNSACRNVRFSSKYHNTYGLDSGGVPTVRM